ncbi:MAG: hypothetical protein WBQ05_13490, partial [Candidatus Competibacter denitrificans]
MSKVESGMEDDLRPEYDIHSLWVRKIGPGRKNLAELTVVSLEPDVAKIFPDSDSANEVLRFLMRIVKKNKLALNMRDEP